MTIVGGTYSEICFEPIWDNIFGSGFRAVALILENNPSEEISFFTCADPNISAHLKYYQKLKQKLQLHVTDIFKSPAFYYDHPLREPSIFPRPDLYNGTNIHISAKGENILAYGLLEASLTLEGNKVVYDPQSPVNPNSFSSTGSTANQLVMIINESEAKKITGTKEISGIKDFFFEKEKCFALIIKRGAKGALLFSDKDSDPIKIPVYQTDQVWSIGSGDVFSAYFAYNWFNGESLVASAQQASRATAIYCNTKDLSVSEGLKSFSFPELIVNSEPTGKVYLAGPFFTFMERWLVNEARHALKGFGLKVFSPFHDVGHGKAKDVVDKDLKGLNECEVVYAIVDGLDSGTIFEIGYATAQKKRTIAFVQNENEEALKMLEGTHCTFVKDFATSIYKTYWALASK